MSSISKFEVGDLVFITYLSDEDGGDIPRLVIKVADDRELGLGWAAYYLAPYHLNSRYEYERNLKLVRAKNPSRVKCL